MPEAAVAAPTGIKTIGYKNVAKMHTFKDMNLLGTVFRIPIQTTTQLSIKPGGAVPEYVVYITTIYGTEEKTLTAPTTTWFVRPDPFSRATRKLERTPDILNALKSFYGSPNTGKTHANVLVAMSYHNTMCNNILASAASEHGYKYVPPER